MPGITGIISKSPLGEDERLLNSMVSCLVHEPTYKSGTLVDPSTHSCVGWAVHAGTFSDCNPIWNETKDVCLIFSGEDFADQSVVDELQSRGHRLVRTNASYLVHLYEELGEDFF